MENQNNPEYTDAAIAGYYFNASNSLTSGTIPFDVVVQNQGNTYLNNLSLDVNYLGINRDFSLEDLPQVRLERKNYMFRDLIWKELKISATLQLNDYPDSKLTIIKE